jgi:hypothetical protein
MLGRAWACVLLMVTLTGCASRSRPKPFLPSMSIPPECTTSIRLIDCDLSFNPARCRTATVTYRKGCEQLAVVVK